MSTFSFKDLTFLEIRSTTVQVLCTENLYKEITMPHCAEPVVSGCRGTREEEWGSSGLGEHGHGQSSVACPASRWLLGW